MKLLSVGSTMSTEGADSSVVMTARQLCLPFARPSTGRALWQLGNTLLPFALLWALMAWSVYAGSSWP